MTSTNNADQLKITIGVVAICRDEERDLPGFLNHLMGWVDEIVLVDDGSSDRTIEIARLAGEKVKAIVSPRKQGEYYSHQRNKGIDAARSDWLLHMDIDERVTPQLKREILTGIKCGEFDAYRFHRVNYFLHRPVIGCGWQLWSHLHLARREKFIFGGYMHELCILTDPKSKVGNLKGKMWHFNEDTYEKRLRKSYIYTTTRAESILDQKNRIHLYDLVLRPIVAFIKTYFLFLGFRDGVTGWIISFHDMTTTFDAYVLVWSQQNQIPRSTIERKFSELE